MKFVRMAVLTALAPLCAGCGSIVEGSTQMINVATDPVTGADCMFSNDRGQWPVVSPGAVVVKKSASILTVVCRKQGYKDGTFYVSGHISTSSLIGMGLPYVGLLSAAVDGSTGAGQNYPGSIMVEMKPLPAAPNAVPAAAGIAPSLVASAPSDAAPAVVQPAAPAKQ